jgi:hypothetical protein
MIRSVIALHDLVLNKIAFKDVEEARDKEDKAKAAGAGAGAGESGGGNTVEGASCGGGRGGGGFDGWVWGCSARRVTLTNADDAWRGVIVGDTGVFGVREATGGGVLCVPLRCDGSAGPSTVWRATVGSMYVRVCVRGWGVGVGGMCLRSILLLPPGSPLSVTSVFHTHTHLAAVAGAGAGSGTTGAAKGKGASDSKESKP